LPDVLSLIRSTSGTTESLLRDRHKRSDLLGGVSKGAGHRVWIIAGEG